MGELKSEFRRVGGVMVGEGEILTWWHILLLGPLVVPMVIFWGIIDFFIGNLPDVLFGLHEPGPHRPLTDEEIAVRKRRYEGMIEAERLERVAEIRRRIFPNGIFPEEDDQ